MCVLLSTYRSRGNVEPMVGLAMRLRALGAEMLTRATGAGRLAGAPAGGDRRDAGRSVAMTGHAVVIAGGGPAGLMLEGELALAKVDVAIVERRASQDLTGLRAGDLHSRTIEVLDQRGT